MPAPAELLDLVARFREQHADYKRGAYNETQLRRDFLDPLFRLLGWDVDNRAGYAESFREVVHEDAVKVGGMTKAPDYSFRIGGRRLFFLEAKKPAVHIKEDIAPAYQLRRYAWSAGLQLSILSDFEEFAVYDGSIKPGLNDKSSKARIFYCTFEEYTDKWDEIAALFSKDAVLKGGIERFVKKLPGRRGTATVDAEFLAQIENWRDLLAKNIALRNDLDVHALNHAVQATIDRIVFLRICEDRGIEDEGRLLALTNGGSIYARLTRLFRDADDRYNSGLFHFRAEKDRAGEPDAYTLNLAIDDKPLRDIIRGLYYPESPYEFSVLPADILGQVYERFLGKVIRLTAGGQARVEEKPEVKKAGGVYYTPTYIVDYIVRQTVGALLEGKTPKQAEKLRICDPACGSGSFLIGAYQYLLDWHLKWYAENEPHKHASGKSPRLRQSHDGWRLAVAERKRILINNIYGVDIDAQAVEVTKLSLLLKVLEGETGETLGLAQMKLFHERALPNLDANILCGNSLIGTDFYDGRLELEEEERRRINAFDWQTGFPDIFPSPSGRGARGEGGGFDAVIGNPPYGALLGEAGATYLRERFVTGKDGLDTYQVFMEQAIRIIADSGKISMIVPSAWYSAPKSSILRRFIASNTDPIAFVNLPYDIFAAWVDTTIFVTEKRKRKTDWQRPEGHLVTLRTFPKRQQIDSADLFFENTGQADMKGWFADANDLYLTYADSTATELLAKILKAGKPLSEFADIQRGVTPFHLLESASHAKAIRAFNGTVRRYVCSLDSPAYIRFDETLAEPKPIRYFQGERLLLRELISRQFRLQATKISTDFVTNKSMQSLLPLPEGPSSNYLLGLINSRLLSWYFINVNSVARRDDFPKIIIQQTRELPIPEISSPVAIKCHEKIVHLVESMLRLNEQLAAAKTAHDKTLIQRQIDATDRQIDALVYELYGLTDEEIRIVEAGNAPA